MDNLNPNILPFCLGVRQKHPLKNEIRRCIEEGRQEALDTFKMKIFISLIVCPLYISGHTILKGSKNTKINYSIFPFTFPLAFFLLTIFC